MEKAAYRQFETEQNGMQILLEFPEKTEDTARIKKEVRQILSCLFQEHFAKKGEYSVENK